MLSHRGAGCEIEKQYIPDSNLLNEIVVYKTELDKIGFKLANQVCYGEQSQKLQRK